MPSVIFVPQLLQFVSDIQDSIIPVTLFGRKCSQEDLIYLGRNVDYCAWRSWALGLNFINHCKSLAFERWTTSKQLLEHRSKLVHICNVPPVFTLVDRGSDNRYVFPAKTATESTLRLLLDNHEKESLTVYSDVFREYDPLDDDDTLDRQYVVHSDGEYADEDVHINTCESHGSLLRP